MPLVEVVRAEKTADTTLATARAFAEACGKTVVDVEDRAGFIVNALLFPYLNNAVKLLDAVSRARRTSNRDEGRVQLPMARSSCSISSGSTRAVDPSCLHAEYARELRAGTAARATRRRWTPRPQVRRGFYDYTKQ